ncbi:MAG TPA: hypothetical protein VIY08_01810 [Candidatus Nitrosocosmicus sp.]
MKQPQHIKNKRKENRKDLATDPMSVTLSYVKSDKLNKSSTVKVDKIIIDLIFQLLIL